ncbi:MAG TPA: hypothetical protein VN641_09285 [Urbifossiella sp.]|nr:hypothetical protein [Urbifossiella sp.]
MAPTLAQELETYQRELPSLEAQAGKYVLISGADVLSTWSSYEDALQEGYRLCGLDKRFLVKKIELVPRVLFNSRSVQPVCHR